MASNKQIFTNSWTSIFYNPSYIIRKNLYNQIERLAPQLQGNLLDFGCGTKPYKHLFNNVKTYTGLDFKAERIKGEATETDLVYDGKTIPTANEQYESVLSTEVFEHVFDLPNTLREIKRVLKPNGLLLFTCPFSYSEHEQPYDYARYTSFALQDILPKHGFEVLELTKTSSFVGVVIQYIAMYIYFIISKTTLTRYVLFPILITPWFLLNELLHLLLPIKILRNDLYHNNVVLCKKM